MHLSLNRQPGNKQYEAMAGHTQGPATVPRGGAKLVRRHGNSAAPVCGVAPALPAGSSGPGRRGWRWMARRTCTPRPRPGRRIGPPAATEPRTRRGSMRSSLGALPLAGRAMSSLINHMGVAFAFPNGLSRRDVSCLRSQIRTGHIHAPFGLHFSCSCCASVKKGGSSSDL